MLGPLQRWGSLSCFWVVGCCPSSVYRLGFSWHFVDRYCFLPLNGVSQLCVSSLLVVKRCRVDLLLAFSEKEKSSSHCSSKSPRNFRLRWKLLRGGSIRHMLNGEPLRCKSEIDTVFNITGNYQNTFPDPGDQNMGS